MANFKGQPCARHDVNSWLRPLGGVASGVVPNLLGAELWCPDSCLGASKCVDGCGQNEKMGGWTTETWHLYLHGLQGCEGGLRCLVAEKSKEWGMFGGLFDWDLVLRSCGSPEISKRRLDATYHRGTTGTFELHSGLCYGSHWWRNRKLFTVRDIWLFDIICAIWCYVFCLAMSDVISLYHIISYYIPVI